MKVLVPDLVQLSLISSSWLFTSSPRRSWLWESSRKPNWDVPSETQTYRGYHDYTLDYWTALCWMGHPKYVRRRRYLTLRLNAVRSRVSSRVHVSVVWCTPETTGRKQSENTSIASLNLSSITQWEKAPTSSCLQEDRCLEADSPPGNLNWGWLLWESLSE